MFRRRPHKYSIQATGLTPIRSFFPLFSTYIYNLVNDLPSISYTTTSVLDDFQSDAVVHLELRTTPRAIPSANITNARYIDIVLSCISAHNASQPPSGMHTSLILSVDRRNSLQEALHVVDLAVARRAQGVVGLDLCGDPARGPVAVFAPVFAKAKAAGLKVTLHFAEAPVSASDEELWTLLSWGPERIGHAIHVKEELKREVVRRRIGVEICLSCNVHARMITGGFGEHHLGWWKGAGVGVAPSVSVGPGKCGPEDLEMQTDGVLQTDDVGVFCSPLSDEYYLAALHFGLSRSDVRQLCEGAVDVVFGDEAKKQRLRDLYASWDSWTRHQLDRACS